jgi:threonine/homoserine/homoserine lactone efflux protein
MLSATSQYAIYVFSFVGGIGAVVSPGPVSTATVRQAPRQGWKTGPLVAVGHALLEFAIVALIMLGQGVGLAHPNIRRVIAVAGGGLLVWMGALMLYPRWEGIVLQSIPLMRDRTQPTLANMVSRLFIQNENIFSKRVQLI